MNLDEIKSILQLMEDKKLVEFEYEDNDRRLKLRRAEDGLASSPAATMPAAAATVAAPAEAARPSNLVEFKSPLVGTFYRSSKPDAEAFVNAGDEVDPDKVLCIIEAMKVLNEAKAEMSGVIKEVLVQNGQAVQFGDPLFLIEKKQRKHLLSGAKAPRKSRHLSSGGTRALRARTHGY